MVNWFIRAAMEGKDITVFGKGDQRRDYIYIDDLVDAFVKTAIEPNTDGRAFNLGSGRGARFRDMAETVVKVVGKGQVKYVPWPKNYLNVETGDFIADVSSLRENINWKAETELKEGIQKTFKYYEKYKKHYC